MNQFLGTHQLRLDAKGRVSVPAPFRAILRSFAEQEPEDAGASLILRPSHQLPCIEAWPATLFNALASSLDRLAMFSEEQEDMATALFADASPMEPDKEGRIVLPESLVTHANLTDGVACMGVGKMFQFWEPAAAERRRAEARARSRNLALPAGRA